MKSFKIFLWTVIFSIGSSGITAMEQEYRPKIYIKNQNTPAYKSPGILCKINDKQLVFVPMNSEKEIGRAGYEGDISKLVLQPSAAGIPKNGWLIGMTEYDLTNKLWTMLAKQKIGSRQDIEIVVDNKSVLGTWNIQMHWISQRRENAISDEEPWHMVEEEGLRYTLDRLKREYEATNYGPLDDEGGKLFNTMERYYKDILSSDVLQLNEEYTYLQNFIRKDLCKYIEKNSSIVGIQKNTLMDVFKQLNSDSNKLAVQIPTVQSSLLGKTYEKILTRCTDQLNLIQESINATRKSLTSKGYIFERKTSVQALLLGALDMTRLITMRLIVLLMDELQERHFESEGSVSEGGSEYYTPESSEEV